MRKGLSERIERASWAGFAIRFGALFLYSAWAFAENGPWARALSAAGGRLPETQPGFPPIEPQRSFDALGAAGATGDYLLWQALDAPYALLSMAAPAAAIALGLKAARLGSTPLRFALLLPPTYLACEAVENSLVAAFAARLLAPGEGAVLVQQAATTVKFASGFSSLGLGALSLAVAAIAALIALARKRA